MSSSRVSPAASVCEAICFSTTGGVARPHPDLVVGIRGQAPDCRPGAAQTLRAGNPVPARPWRYSKAWLVASPTALSSAVQVTESVFRPFSRTTGFPGGAGGSAANRDTPVAACDPAVAANVRTAMPASRPNSMHPSSVLLDMYTVRHSRKVDARNTIRRHGGDLLQPLKIASLSTPPGASQPARPPDAALVIKFGPGFVREGLIKPFVGPNMSHRDHSSTSGPVERRDRPKSVWIVREIERLHHRLSPIGDLKAD